MRTMYNHPFFRCIGLLILLLMCSCSSTSHKNQIVFLDDKADSLQLGTPDLVLPLDSRVESLGDRALLSVKERNGMFYLLDGQSKKLYSISSGGNTEYVIDRVGRGPGEYLNILDFDVSKDGSVYLLTGEGDEVMLFSEGRFINKFQIGFRASSMAFMYDNDIAFFKQRYEDDYLGKNVIVITDPQFKVKNAFLEESNTILTGSGEHLVSGTCNSILCYQQYENNLYWFDRDGILSRQTIDFGEKVFPESFLAVEDFGEMFPLLSEMSAYYINSCFENKHHILLNITLCDHMNENDRYICLYNKKDQKTFVKSVERDSDEYEMKGLPIHLTQDNKMVFLFDGDKTSLNESKYSLVFFKLK